MTEDHAGDVVAHLMDPQLFSGWGVRTLAAGQPAFNPIEYHNGTVWPHDNALIALGLRRYGYAEEAARVAGAFIDACGYFDHRLPETFAGFDRAAIEVSGPLPHGMLTPSVGQRRCPCVRTGTSRPAVRWRAVALRVTASAGHRVLDLVWRSRALGRVDVGSEEVDSPKGREATAGPAELRRR